MVLARRDQFGVAALSVLVLAALAAGFWASGGPGQARMERRDNLRVQDLAKLRKHAICQASDAGGEMPDLLTSGPPCGPAAMPADPETGEAYLYEKVDKTHFRLCAPFESPDTLRQPAWFNSDFDPETGCVSVRYQLAETR